MGIPAPPPTARRRSARRARNALASAVVTMLLLNAGLILLVDRRPGVRDPVFDVKLRELTTRFDAPGTSIRLTAIGSSRTAAAIDPRALESAVTQATGRTAIAYNLGLQGNGPISQLVHYRRLRTSGQRPDVLIVELLPSTFAWKGDRPYDATVLRPDRITRDELDVVCQYGFPEDETRSEWRETTLNPWFGLRFQILGRVASKWLPPGVPRAVPANRDPTGWAPWDPYPAAIVRQRVAEVRAMFEPQLRTLQFRGLSAAAFEELLRECRRDGLRLAVVVPPEGSEFRSWYPESVATELLGYLARLRMEHEVMVLDAREWLPDEAFADGHHVLRNWAKVYTARLVREITNTVIRSPGEGER